MLSTAVFVAMIAGGAARAAPDDAPADDAAKLDATLAKLASGANGATQASTPVANRSSLGLSQPTFLQPTSAARAATYSTRSPGSLGPTDPQAVTPDGTVTISDSDDRQSPPTEGNEMRQRHRQSRWPLLWNQLSPSDNTNQQQQPTSASADAPASLSSAGTSTGSMTSGLLRQFLGINNNVRSPSAAVPAGAERAAQAAATVSPQDGPTRGSGSSVRQALATQVLGPSAGGASMERTPAEPAATVPPGYPALPEEVRLAEQRLTQSAAGGARELWEQLRGTAEEETSATTADATSGSLPAAPPTRPAPRNLEPAGGDPNDNPWAGLWRPMSMTNRRSAVADAALQSANASGASAAATSANAAAQPEAERVPRLLRPMFYMTQDTASRQQALVAAQNAASRSGPGLEQRVGDTSLFRQLALSENEDLQASPLSSTAGQLASESGGWLPTWTEPWLAMTNQLTMSTEPARPAARTGEAIQVAFLQDATLTPDPDELAPDKLKLPGDDQAESDGDAGDENGGGDDEKKEGSLAQADRLGDEPEDNTLEFLRTQTVLLDPGETRCDIGLEYTFGEFDFPVLLTDGNLIVGVDDLHIRSRELAMPVELRYGLLRRVQLFLQVPVGWSNIQGDVNNTDFYLNDGGLGDISWGATVQLQDATKDSPYIIGTLSATAPTGGNPFTGAAGGSPSGPSLGNGFWAVAANVTVIRVYDPVVVYYGLGARRQFGRTFLGVDFDPGPEYNYTLGVGFSVNEKVTLSTQFFGSYIEDLKADGARIEGSNQEPMSLRLAATFARPHDRLVEPFVAFGVTNDAADANFGITWTF